MRDWQRLVALPAPVVDSFWEVLGPFLVLGPGRDFEQRLEAYCRLRQVEAREVLPALNACQLLVNEAVARDLGAESLARDLEQLPDPRDRAGAMLVRGYEQARPALRQRILSDSLLDHGNVLTGVDWRLDQTLASTRGVQLNAPVAVVTLRYRSGERADRITLYLDAQRLQELRAVCDRLLGAPGPPAAGGS